MNEFSRKMKAVADYNHLVERIKSHNPESKLERKLLSQPPTENDFKIARKVLQEMRTSGMVKDKSTVRVISIPIINSMKVKYIDHLQPKKIDNEYIDMCLEHFDKTVKEAFEQLKRDLFIEN